jgi:hypothetical protein
MNSLPRELVAVEQLLKQQESDGPSVAFRNRTLHAVRNVLPTDPVTEHQSLPKVFCMRSELDSVSAVALVGMALSLAWVWVGWLSLQGQPAPVRIRPLTTLAAQARELPSRSSSALRVAATNTAVPPVARSGSKEPARRPHILTPQWFRHDLQGNL